MVQMDDAVTGTQRNIYAASYVTTDNSSPVVHLI
jgi:hypothetical protein